MRAPSGSLAAALLLATVAVGVTALWLRFHAPPPQVGSVLPSDALHYFYPLAAQAAARWGAGELPLWNPHACSGIPLLATLQVGALYPPNALALLLPVGEALALRMFLECLLAGLGMALLLRAWRLGLPACAAGGILFVYGALLGQTFWPPEVATICWLPWLLLCVETLIRRWRWGWWVGLAVATASQLVAGFPQLAVYSQQLLLAYAAVRALTVIREGRPAGPLAWRLVGVGCGLLLGAGLASAQLLPTWELVALGVRSEGAPVEELHYLRKVVSPGQLFANAVDPSPKLVTFDWGDGSGYVGTATLLLAAVAVAASRQRALVGLFLATGGLGLLLSFGLEGPGAALYELYAQLPGVAWFRAPQRILLLVLFSLFALAALGLDEAARGLPRRPRAALAASALAALGLGAAGVAFAGSAVTGALGAATAGLVACSFLTRSHPPLRAAAATALLLLVVGDAIHATARSGSWRSFPVIWSESYHSDGALLLDAEGARALREELGLARAELLQAAPFLSPPALGGYRISCYEPLAPEPWPLLARRTGASTLRGRFLLDLEPRRYASLYEVSSVARVLAPSPRARQPNRGWLKRWREPEGHRGPDPTRGVQLLRWDNREALPRAYAVGRYAVVSQQAALDHVLRGDVDFHSTVLLDGAPRLEPEEASGPWLRPATIAAYAPERVVVDVELEQAGVLVLTDSDYPGWRAELDGEETPILRANGLYRAVAVPPGKHQVVFDYRPASLRWGVAGSLLSALALAAAPLAARLLGSGRTPAPGRRGDRGSQGAGTEGS